MPLDIFLWFMLYAIGVRTKDFRAFLPCEQKFSSEMIDKKYKNGYITRNYENDF